MRIFGTLTILTILLFFTMMVMSCENDLKEVNRVAGTAVPIITLPLASHIVILPPSLFKNNVDAAPLLRAIISLLSIAIFKLVVEPKTPKPPDANSASVPPSICSFTSGVDVPIPKLPEKYPRPTKYPAYWEVPLVAIP